MTMDRAQTEMLTACCWLVASSDHDELAAILTTAILGIFRH